MRAAGELIAELGWGRVTTRAVAERAALPHGTVSYHFRGKRQLLTDSAMHAFEHAIPIEQFQALRTVDDLMELIAAEVGDRDMIDPVASRLMLEAMREAERDDLLRERMRGMLRAYRQVVVELVRAGQQRGDVLESVPADAIATLLGAVGDGLLLHVLLDPDLNTRAAIDALRELLQPHSAGATHETR